MFPNMKSIHLRDWIHTLKQWFSCNLICRHVWMRSTRWLKTSHTRHWCLGSSVYISMYTWRCTFCGFTGWWSVSLCSYGQQSSFKSSTLNKTSLSESWSWLCPYEELMLRISTIWGQLTDGTHWTVGCCYWWNLYPETELEIQVKKHQIDSTELSMVMDDKKS